MKDATSERLANSQSLDGASLATMNTTRALASIIAWTGEAGIAIRSLSGRYNGDTPEDAAGHIFWIGEILHQFGNYGAELVHAEPESLRVWASDALTAIDGLRDVTDRSGITLASDSLAYLARSHRLHIEHLREPLRFLASPQQQA